MHLVICVIMRSQTHLKVRLFFEPSQSLPVDDHDVPPWVFAVIGPFLSTYTVTQNLMSVVCCTLAVQCTFFQMVFCWIIASFI